MSDIIKDKSHRKRDYALAGLIIVGILIAIYFKYDFDNILFSEVTELKGTVTENSGKLNQTSKTANETKAETVQTREAVENLSFNQNLSFQNQRVIAKGVNDLGAILITDVREIKDKANLIDDIKFDTTQILNKSAIKNITLTDTNLTNITIP